MLTRISSLLLVSSLLACGGKGAPADSTKEVTNAPTESEVRVSAVADQVPSDKTAKATSAAPAVSPSAFNLPMAISAWSSWPKANDEPWLSKSHNKAIVDVYVSKEHLDAYKARKGPMPSGTTLVKAQYEDKGGGEKGEGQNLTVMIKMEKGFDPERGNWYYGVYTFDGKNVLLEGKSDGKTAMCSTCHDSADTDYVFGTP